MKIFSNNFQNLELTKHPTLVKMEDFLSFKSNAVQNQIEMGISI